jgi:hypothetical protein
VPNVVRNALKGLLAVALVAVLAAPAPSQAQVAQPEKRGDARSKLPEWLGGDRPEFFFACRRSACRPSARRVSSGKSA